MRNVWKLLLICLGFTVIGVFMILEGDGFDAWLVASFFGLGLVVTLAQFWPAASYLKLTPKGFVCCTLFRNWSAGWGIRQRVLCRAGGQGREGCFQAIRIERDEVFAGHLWTDAAGIGGLDERLAAARDRGVIYSGLLRMATRKLGILKF